MVKYFPPNDHVIYNGNRYNLEFDYAEDTGATFVATSPHDGSQVCGKGHISNYTPDQAWNDWNYIREQIEEALTSKK